MSIEFGKMGLEQYIDNSELDAMIHKNKRFVIVEKMSEKFIRKRVKLYLKVIERELTEVFKALRQK